MKYLPILFLLVFIACKKKSNTSSGIDSKVKLSYGNYFPNRSYYFFAQTDKSYSCGSYDIEDIWNRQAAACTLTFTGIKAPQTCDNISSSAYSDVKTDIADFGTYNLAVVNGDRSANATLMLTKDFATVSYQPNDIFYFEHDTVYSLPESTIFAYVMWQSDRFKAVADSFLDSIVSLGVQPFSGPTGAYDYFSVLPDRTLVVPPNSVWEGTKGVAYKFTGDTTSLYKMYGRYFSRSSFDSLGIQLVTGVRR